jgi:hypothetical protein
MGARDPRMDAYIKKSAPFAQPILTYLRAVVHEACPDVQETMKWSFPPSQKRDYVDWVTEAKGEETRERRLATAIQWMAEGKPRHWKYMKS